MFVLILPLKMIVAYLKHI